MDAASWGVWWEWEPRLTTYFIMTLLMIAYFVLRNSIEDEERRAIYAAVFGIIAWIDAPISFVITRLIPSNHPVVFTVGHGDARTCCRSSSAQFGMLMIGYAVYVAPRARGAHARATRGRQGRPGRLDAGNRMHRR